MAPAGSTLGGMYGGGSSAMASGEGEAGVDVLQGRRAQTASPAAMATHDTLETQAFGPETVGGWGRAGGSARPRDLPPPPQQLVTPAASYGQCRQYEEELFGGPGVVEESREQQQHHPDAGPDVGSAGGAGGSSGKRRGGGAGAAAETHALEHQFMLHLQEFQLQDAATGAGGGGAAATPSAAAADDVDATYAGVPADQHGGNAAGWGEAVPPPRAAGAGPVPPRAPPPSASLLAPPPAPVSSQEQLAPMQEGAWVDMEKVADMARRKGQQR